MPGGRSDGLYGDFRVQRSEPGRKLTASAQLLPLSATADGTGGPYISSWPSNGTNYTFTIASGPVVSDLADSAGCGYAVLLVASTVEWRVAVELVELTEVRVQCNVPGSEPGTLHLAGVSITLKVRCCAGRDRSSFFRAQAKYHDD